MMAYPPANHFYWHAPFYLWLAATAVFGTIWIRLVFGLVQAKAISTSWWILAGAITVAMLFFVIVPTIFGSLGLDIHWIGFH